MKLRIQALIEIEVSFPKDCTGDESKDFTREVLHQTEYQLMEVLEACDNFMVVKVITV